MKRFTYTIRTTDVEEMKKRRYARLTVTRAIKIGMLQKPTCCELCKQGKGDIEAHHVDYGRPLHVTWLCRKCHGLAHRKGHSLNPNRHPQTPLPIAMDEIKTIMVNIALPIDVFMRLTEASTIQKKPIRTLLKEQIIKTYPSKQQLEFNFEVPDDNSQFKPIERIQSMAQDENHMPKPKITKLRKVRRKRDNDLRPMDQQFPNLFEGNGPDAGLLQRIASY